MMDRQQSSDQGGKKSRKTSSRRAKGYWIIRIVLLAAGFVSLHISPVFARNSFNNPVVPTPTRRFTGSDYQSRYVPAPNRGFRRSSRRDHRTRYVVPSPSRRSYSRHRRSVRPRRRFPRGRIFATLPLGYAAVTLYNNLYYYHSGNFYRKAPGGYMIVDAPLGAVIPSLPVGYSFLVVDGMRYYTYDGQYYLPVSQGYRIVSDPRNTVPQPLISNQVTVISDRLNVRSGPGLHHHIANIVYRGAVLQVLQRNFDWLYVQLPDNNRGWVMTRFTAPAVRRADG